MSGVLSVLLGLGSANSGSFTPVTQSQTVAGNYTITIPNGASNMQLEVFGASGGGSGGHGTGCGADVGQAGAVGGYSYTNVSVAGAAFQTIAVTLGAAGAAGTGGGGGGGTGGAGGASVASSGSFTIATMTDNGGNGGVYNSATAGGTASGGTNTNTTGTGALTLTPSATPGLVGINGSGGASGRGGVSGNTHPGTAGADGRYFARFT